MNESGKGCCSFGGDSSEDIKDVVRRKYGEAAVSATQGGSCGCCNGTAEKDAITRDLYSEAETAGIPIEALMASLGCANPHARADLKPGETVLDLGSGGGIDVLLSAKRVGPTGKAYGLDMTDEMLELARRNQAEAGIENAEFLKGDIESIPLPDATVDVIISNCVINLSPDKDRVLREAYRVLKPGGRFAVADIVLTRDLPEPLRSHVPLWTGCVAGALRMDEYETKLSSAGFEQIEIEVARTYSAEDADGLAPPELVAELGEQGIRELVSSFVSALVRARKPGGS